jgi:hypothetical protein
MATDLVALRFRVTNNPQMTTNKVTPKDKVVS